MATVAGGGNAGSSDHDPFAWLAPPVVVKARDVAAIDGGAPLVQVMRGDGDVAVFGAIRVEVDGARLAARTAALEHLRTGDGRYIASAVRFSDPPRLEDLASLSLDEKDLADLRDCQPGDCGVKLDTGEIRLLRQAVASGGRDWKAPTQEAFRAVVLARALAYRSGTPAAFYHDDEPPVTLRDEFARVIDASPFLRLHLPEVTEYLEAYPHASGLDGESFLYWSREVYGSRPIICITHVTVVQSPARSRPEALVVSRQVFATHYSNAALSLTAVTRPVGGGPRYLLYMNRARVDLLAGPFGGLVQRIIERRVRAEAPGLLDALRRRLEAPAGTAGIPVIPGNSHE